MEEQHRDRLDSWLDRALRQCGEGSPEPGFEGRIIANLRSQQYARVASKWVWILGGPIAAAVLIALVWRGQFANPKQPVTNLSSGISHHGGIQQVEKLAPEIPVKRNGSKAVRAESVRAAEPQRKSAPRLDRFPSPARLRPEELVLAQYAQSFPEEAKLIAKEQQKFEAQVQQAQQEFEKTF